MCMAKDVRLKLEKASGVIGDIRPSGDRSCAVVHRLQERRAMKSSNRQLRRTLVFSNQDLEFLVTA